MLKQDLGIKKITIQKRDFAIGNGRSLHFSINEQDSHIPNNRKPTTAEILKQLLFHKMQTF